MGLGIDAAYTVSHCSQDYRSLGLFKGRYVILEVDYAVLLLVEMAYLTDESLSHRDKTESCGSIESLLVVGVDQRGGYVLEVVDKVDTGSAVIKAVTFYYACSILVMTGKQVSVGERGYE